MFFMTVVWFRWSRGSVLAFSTQVCGFKPGRSRRIFRAKKILTQYWVRSTDHLGPGYAVSSIPPLPRPS